MRVIPVIDLMGGNAVHAVAGERARYRPVQSVFGHGSDVLTLVERIREQLGLDELYVADLDAIQGRGHHRRLLTELGCRGFKIWYDPGVRDFTDIRRLTQLPLHVLIFALETAPPPEQTRKLLQAWHAGPQQAAFSVDQRDGRLLGRWTAAGAEDVAACAVQIGFRQLILLELASVGRSTGPSVCALGAQLKRRWPAVRLIGGGGVRDVRDLLEARRAGFDGYLVATALYHGAIGKAELELLGDGQQPSGRTDT